MVGRTKQIAVASFMALLTPLYSFAATTDHRNRDVTPGAPTLSNATPRLSFVTPQSMSVEDLLVDKNDLKGRTVAVTGSAYCMSADWCSLASPQSPMSSVMFKVSALKRDDRKRLLACNPFNAPCKAVVTGVVTPDQISPLVASDIAFAPTDEELAVDDTSLPTCDTVSETEIKSIVTNSPLARMMRLEVLRVRLDAQQDEQGHMRCMAHVTTNGGEKSFKYHLKRESDQVMIVGSWVS